MKSFYHKLVLEENLTWEARKCEDWARTEEVKINADTKTLKENIFVDPELNKSENQDVEALGLLWRLKKFKFKMCGYNLWMSGQIEYEMVWETIISESVSDLETKGFSRVASTHPRMVMMDYYH